MNILISTSSFGEVDKSVLKKLNGFTVILNPYKRTLSETEIKELLIQYEVDGLIAGVEPITRNTLMSARRLKVISRCGSGMDSVDLETAGELGIKVFNTPDVSTNAVAELALGLILDCLRRISLSDRLMRQEVWKKTMGNLLKGKIVGIIGFGRIGRQLGKLVRAFDCKVIYYDLVKAGLPWARFVELEELLRSADIVSLHLPLTRSDSYLIGAERITLMKNGAILINTARGALVDEEALCQALKSGKLAAAGIDVFEKEPYCGQLTQLDNVVLTCHIGGYAAESRVIMEREAVDNLLKGLREEPQRR